jgi:RNA polymerase sigma-54 factor
MDFEQRQTLSPAQRQEQVMTHHQIQALELLSQPVLELQSAINAELEKNPVLETDFDDAPDPKELAGEDDEWLEKVLKLDEESRFIRGRTVGRVSEEEEERRQNYLDSITEEMTFQQSLLEQLKFLDLDDKLRNACEVVVSGLDDDGYLKSHPADLAMAAGASMELIAKAIGTVQELEPAGVAAKDLRERLLLQLDRKDMGGTLAYIAIRDHLDDIGGNRLPQVAKKMGIDIEGLKGAIETIQTLSPRLVAEPVSPHEYIREEVDIEEEAGELKVKMNNEYLPSLRISGRYKEMLKDANTPKDTRDYIKDKIRAGVFLINSVIQRQTTIRKIVAAIVEWQADFFLKGANHMRPMTMAQIAEKAGIHETTVSRAVAGKHLRCKHGLIPMRKFFSTGYEAEDGSIVSNNVVKDIIRGMVDKEDSAKPLSDSEIAADLKKQGYNVARRTVAKYRDLLAIPPSNLRRQY